MSRRTMRVLAIIALVGDVAWSVALDPLLSGLGPAPGMALMVWWVFQWALFGMFFRSTSPGTGLAAGLWALALGWWTTMLPNPVMIGFSLAMVFAWRAERRRVASERPWEKQPRRPRDAGTASPTRTPPAAE